MVSYLLYAILSLVLARRETGFEFSTENRRDTLWLSLAAVVAFSASEWGSDVGLGVALLTAFVCTVVAATRLLVWTRRDSVELPVPVAAIGSRRFRR